MSRYHNPTRYCAFIHKIEIKSMHNADMLHSSTSTCFLFFAGLRFVSCSPHACTPTHLLVLYRWDRSSSPGTPSASCRSGSVSPSTRHPPEPGPGFGPCGAAAGTVWCPGSSEVRWDSDGFVERWQLPRLPDWTPFFKRKRKKEKKKKKKKLLLQ